MLVGREPELRRVATLLDEARRGRSGVLVLSGEPGIGKSAILREAQELGRDLRVLSATGVESESELPYASLHLLISPLLELLERIPPAQAGALRAALALADGEPDALAIAAGTLSLLVEAAEEVSVLVVLDDAHWLDRASAQALAFAVRRLAAEELVVLVACRAGYETPFDVLPRLEVEPLSTDAARALLAQRAEAIPAADVAGFLAVSGGNPLALLELPAAVAQQLPVSATLDERLRRAFAQRLGDLAETARVGLLLAAAEPDLRAFRRAAEALGLSGPLAQPEAAGLIRIEAGEIVFRHPVVRSLVYAEAPADARRAVHQALADSLTDEGDRDRRAWHLAASVDGTDEGVAGLLEQTAEWAAARGGHAAEARALERAAQLSPDPADRARRLYRASRAAFWAGDATRALALAEEALPLTEDPLLRADLLVQVGAIGQWRGAEVPQAALLRALDADGLDDERSSKLLFEVVKLRLDGFDAAGAAALAPRLERHARGAGPWWGPRGLAGAAAAYLLAGRRAAAEALFRELVANPAMPAGFAYDYLALEWYDELRASLEETLREGRSTGNLLRVVWNQGCIAHLEVRLGRLSAAAAAAAEAIPLGEAIGTPALVGAASGALALVHAWRGQTEVCLAAARVALDAAQTAGDRYQEGVARQAVALLALGADRPGEAIAELEPLARFWAGSTVVEPSAVSFVPEFVEALSLTGAADEARAWLSRYSKLATDAGHAGAIAACLRCEVGLAADEDFEPLFERAVAALERGPLVLELARTRLAFAGRLRRAGRRRDARAHLRAAFDAFDAAGALPWRSKAATELAAIGDRVTQEPRRLPDLTPQELHIASLVAQGKSNKEVAAVLYLSPKTVEYHLANTFRKLDIHSRVELARLVADASL